MVLFRNSPPASGQICDQSRQGVTGLQIGLCGVQEYTSAPLLDFPELADNDVTIRIDDNNPLGLHGLRLNGGAIRLPRSDMTISVIKRAVVNSVILASKKSFQKAEDILCLPFSI